MKIAVFIEQNVSVGGGFQQAVRTVLVLNKQRTEAYNFIFFTRVRENIPFFRGLGIEVIYLNISLWDKILSIAFRGELINVLLSSLKKRLDSPIEKELKKHRIELVYFISQSTLPLYLRSYNYVYTLWDLCHRDYPEFPEVYAHGEFENREALFRRVLIKAVAILVDSQLGKENTVSRYRIDPPRVSVLPYLPSHAVEMFVRNKPLQEIDVRTKYKITNPYVYYPAQFWAHKNHIYILEGLKVLKEKYEISVDAVFSGSDIGNLKHVMTYAENLGMRDRVHYLGFVPNEDVPYLYTHAIALVMPSYFGPTNIPPLEAFALGVPVLYSDLPGLRDQVQDAALLLDLSRPEHLAEQLSLLMNDPILKTRLITQGKTKIGQFSEQDYWLIVKKIFDQYEVLRKCGGNIYDYT